MRNKFEMFINTNFNDYDPPEYLSDVERQRFLDSVAKMLEMNKLLKKSIDTINTSEVPLKLIEGLEGIIDDYLEMKTALDDSRTPKVNYSPNNIFNRIHSRHAQFFEPSSGNKSLMVIGAISNYEFFFGEKPLKKLEDLNSELEKKNKQIDGILEKLEKPSSERLLSDYAHEYGIEEGKNNDRSRKWLIAGIVISVLFILLVVASVFWEWFPQKLKLEEQINGVINNHEIINVPILATKVMLISLIVYFITFCFKQYSIQKHLSIINQQRKNAFNSYVLFDASMGEKDIHAKKALLMSLAKTIHESTNTGFISSKQAESPINQNIDLGKNISGS
jgi:hypothetical protein